MTVLSRARRSEESPGAIRFAAQRGKTREAITGRRAQPAKRTIYSSLNEVNRHAFAMDAFPWAIFMSLRLLVPLRRVFCYFCVNSD